MLNSDLIKLKELIDSSKRIVLFSGAGISTESGIRDFRSEDGLYQLKSKYGAPYEVMLSHTYFMYNTDTFYQFYKEFMCVTTAKANDAHKYFANLEKRKNVTVVTQNIDGLHQQAGSKNVIELHGSIHRNYCMRCHKFYSLEDILMQSGTPRCSECSGLIKPDVVLYEEGLEPSVIEGALNAIENADLLIIGGTSLSVYPAAGFINCFKGNKLVVINKTHSPISQKVTLEINEPIGKVFKALEELDNK